MKRHAFPLALTGALAALVLSGCGDDDPNQADDPASTPASETSDAGTPTDTTTVTTSEEPGASDTTDATAETRSVPVFFVGDTPQGPRLFAEQREIEVDNPVAESLALLEAGDAADPDYRTLVPADSLEGDAGFDGIGDDGYYALNLTDAQWIERPAGMSSAQAELAVQQLVYTLLAQAGDGEVEGATGGVDFYLDGEHVTYLGVVGTVNPAPSIDVRALVNVTSPAEGATVSGSFSATGLANSFEATVPWEVRDASGEVVLNGFSTAEGAYDKLYPWEATVDVSDLDPGTYTFAALTDDPSGGEGPGPTEDTKTIVVE